jgi:hypothetical protein
MSFDPMPVDCVVATVHQFIQPLPKIGIFNGLLGGGTPASGFPAMDPFGDALAYSLSK